MKNRTLQLWHKINDPAGGGGFKCWEARTVYLEMATNALQNMDATFIISVLM